MRYRLIYSWRQIALDRVPQFPLVADKDLHNVVNQLAQRLPDTRVEAMDGFVTTLTLLGIPFDPAQTKLRDLVKQEPFRRYIFFDSECWE